MPSGSMADHQSDPKYTSKLAILTAPGLGHPLDPASLSMKPPSAELVVLIALMLEVRGNYEGDSVDEGARANWC